MSKPLLLAIEGREPPCTPCDTLSGSATIKPRTALLSRPLGGDRTPMGALK